MSTASAKAKAALQDQVNATIAKVRTAQAAGVAAIKADWLAGDAGQRSIAVINGFDIAGWAQRGQTAVSTGKTPGAMGWDGWTKAGQVFADGIAEQAKMGKAATLDAITATVEQAAVTTAKQVKSAAASVSDAASAVGSTVASGLKFTALTIVGGAVLAVVALALFRRV